MSDQPDPSNPSDPSNAPTHRPACSHQTNSPIIDAMPDPPNVQSAGHRGIVQRELGTARLVWLVGWVSAAVLGLEIALMRIWLVASYHHFAFVVISIALLGFGAAGTCLCLLRGPLLAARTSSLRLAALATAVSIPVAAALSGHVPIEARIVPGQAAATFGGWLLLWALLTVPFFLGAMTICLSLMAAGDRVAGVYGANLLGSGAGALLAPLLMVAVPPEWLPLVMAGLAAVGAAAFIGARPGRIAAAVACAGVLVVWLVLDPPRIRFDPFKHGAFLRRLEQQGTATRIEVRQGAGGTIELHRSEVFHDVPFLSVGASPPPLDSLSIDGHWAASLPRIGEARDAEFVDHTLMAFAYELVPPRPRVLLLGESGAVNVWLAARRDARRIDVVQSNPQLIALWRSRPAEAGGAAWRLPSVRVIAAEPRHAVQHAATHYDLIQLAQMESLSSVSGGMGGLGEDHLATVEGISACLLRLDKPGLLVLCRGMQTPPRDNLKLMATIAASLRDQGVKRPGEHVVVVRDFLAVCTVVRMTPFDAPQIDQVRLLCAERDLTPVWFAGIRSDELNKPDTLPGPAGTNEDWYHRGAVSLFGPGPGPDPGRFIDQWPFDIRPPTDDRPFFADFFRWSALSELREADPNSWLLRAELSFLFVLAAMIGIVVVGAALTVVPVLAHAGVRRAPAKTATAVYFTALGLAYLMLEITALSRLRLLVGDPVQTAAITIASFLIFSGLGSLTVQRVGARLINWIPALLILLVIVAAITVPALQPLGLALGTWPLWARGLAAAAAVAPLAFCMGLPMPAALARLDRSAPKLIPWAWAANAFASVLAPPLATAIAMAWGFRYAAMAAMGVYLIATVAYRRLPAANPAFSDPQEATGRMTADVGSGR